MQYYEGFFFSVSFLFRFLFLCWCGLVVCRHCVAPRGLYFSLCVEYVFVVVAVVMLMFGQCIFFKLAFLVLCARPDSASFIERGLSR